jgi:glucose-6-phosphate isomerase
VVYFALTAPVPKEPGELVYCTTIIHPGRVGDEYFMTRGHHHVLDSGEVYLGLSGDGLMVMQTRDQVVRTAPLSTSTVVYVPPGWAHRTVNTGERDLVFLAVYAGDAGHDYASVDRDGFTVRVIAGASGPHVIATGPVTRTRSASGTASPG